MSENNNNTNQTAQTQAQAEPEIKLMLTPDELEEENAKQLAALETSANELEDAKSVIDPIDETVLTEAERKTVNDFSEKIDITESNTILQYGSA
ncbi:MAG: toxic anion resistance protein, partial [Solobacterium sp.]|nr:toxic anion resistance protein [Solobacterium sp.]